MAQVDPASSDAQPNPAHLSHVRADGSAHMVDVTDKTPTKRMARAEAVVLVSPEVHAQIFSGSLPKGDVIAVARIAGIQAAKRTYELIPLCHPLPLTGITVECRSEPNVQASAYTGTGALPKNNDDEYSPTAITTGCSRTAIRVEASVTTTANTGVEMEALTAASVAALTIYDMVKALDRGATIKETRVIHKSGGASGLWEAPRAGETTDTGENTGTKEAGETGESNGAEKLGEAAQGRPLHPITDSYPGQNRSAAVIVVSTSAAAHQAEDTTGPMLRTWLETLGYSVSHPMLSADGAPLSATLDYVIAKAPELLITTGGTGLSRRPVRNCT